MAGAGPIVGAALTVADSEGPEAVGVRRVARELGVTPMALYRYVPPGDGLAAAVREGLFVELAVPPDTIGWRDGLAQLGRSFRDLVERHPGAVALMMSGAGEGPNERRVCTALEDGFRRAGFDDAAADLLSRQFSRHVLGLSRDGAGFELGLGVFLDGVDAAPRRRA